MKNNLNEYIFSLFQLPFFIIRKILQWMFYKILILSTIIAIFIYLITPTKHCINIIYKLLFFINKCIDLLYKKKNSIVCKKNIPLFLENTSLKNTEKKNLNNKQCYIFTTINNIEDILKIIKLLESKSFLMYFTEKKKLSFIGKRIISLFEKIQRNSIKKKGSIPIRVIIQDNILQKKELKKIMGKNKELFIFEHQKNTFSLFY